VSEAAPSRVRWSHGTRRRGRAAIQELVAVNLEHFGHEVLRASSAEEAQAAFASRWPTCWCRLDAAGRVGLSLARRLRADARTRDLPILMLTRAAMEQDKISGLEAGADDYSPSRFLRRSSPRASRRCSGARAAAVGRRGRDEGLRSTGRRAA